MLAGSIAQSKLTDLVSDLSAKALNSAVVHNTGMKTFLDKTFLDPTLIKEIQNPLIQIKRLQILLAIQRH